MLVAVFILVETVDCCWLMPSVSFVDVVKGYGEEQGLRLGDIVKETEI